MKKSVTKMTTKERNEHALELIELAQSRLRLARMGAGPYRFAKLEQAEDVLTELGYMKVEEHIDDEIALLSKRVGSFKYMISARR